MLPITIRLGNSRGQLAAYLIVEGVVHDQVRWSAYRSAVLPLIASHGGERLAGSSRPELLEGTRADWIVALFVFPSVQAIHGFWNSSEYVSVKALRRGAADLEIRVVSGARASGSIAAPDRAVH